MTSPGVFPKISQGVFPETSQGSGTLPGSLKTLSGGSGNLRKQLQTCLEEEVFGNLDLERAGISDVGFCTQLKLLRGRGAIFIMREP